MSSVNLTLSQSETGDSLVENFGEHAVGAKPLGKEECVCPNIVLL